MSFTRGGGGKSMDSEIFNPNDSLTEAIEKSSCKMLKVDGVDAKAILWAIAGNETLFGCYRKFVRQEAAFLPDGKFYKNSDVLQNEYKKYGVLASSSIGTWQIMYISAYEIGYRLHPIFLQVNSIAVEWVVSFINKRILSRGATIIDEIFDAYNSGSFKDKFIPAQYIGKGKFHYTEYLIDPSTYHKRYK